MISIRMLLVLLLALLLLSCATAGKPIEMSVVQEKIVLNQSTTQDVLDNFGEPLSKNYNAKYKTEVWHYAHVKKNITGGGVVTHILGVGSEWKSNTVVVDFYFRDGVVVDISNDSSKIKKFHLQM